MAKGRDIYSERQRRSLDTLALARREGIPIERAAPRSGTTLSEVRRCAGSAIVHRNGHWWAKPHDNLPRPMRFMVDRGYVALTILDSDEASLIGEHANAIRAYLQPPHSTKQLKRFERAYVVVDGKRYEFVTDPRTINRLARAGVIYFMDLYADGGL
jgi:hypothetical protein